jgi:predicted flap endonuclease-1-like 5' DNA nuclease
MELSKQREIENLATNTPNLKDWAKKGLDSNGNAKQGYHILKDNRVIKLKDLYPTQRKAEENKTLPDDVEQAAAQYPDLKDLKGIGTDKASGNVKKGFYKLNSGKVISIKQLNKAMTEAAKKTTTKTEQ